MRQIKLTKGKRYYFGLFIDENEAAQVYKSAVRRIKGEYAR